PSFPGNGGPWPLVRRTRARQRTTDGRPDARGLAPEPENSTRGVLKDLDVDPLSLDVQELERTGDSLVDGAAFSLDRSHGEDLQLFRRPEAPILLGDAE